MKHDETIEKNVQEMQVDLKAMLEEMLYQLPRLQVLYRENKELKVLREQLRVQRDELESYKAKCSEQDGVIKKLETDLAACQRELKVTKDDMASAIVTRDAEIAELKKRLRETIATDADKLAALKKELDVTQRALDQDESELKKDRELLIKDKQELAGKDAEIEGESQLAAPTWAR